MWFVVFSKENEHLKNRSLELWRPLERVSALSLANDERHRHAQIDGFFVIEFLAYRTRQGFFGSNFQPGIRNCIGAASSREPEGSFR